MRNLLTKHFALWFTLIAALIAGGVFFLVIWQDRVNIAQNTTPDKIAAKVSANVKFLGKYARKEKKPEEIPHEPNPLQFFEEEPATFLDYLPRDIPPIFTPSLLGEGRFVPVYNSPPGAGVSPLAAQTFLRAVNDSDSVDMTIIKFAGYAQTFHILLEKDKKNAELQKDKLVAAFHLPSGKSAGVLTKKRSGNTPKLESGGGVIEISGFGRVSIKQVQGDYKPPEKPTAVYATQRAIIVDGKIPEKIITSSDGIKKSDRLALGLDDDNNFIYVHAKAIDTRLFADALKHSGIKAAIELTPDDKTQSDFVWYEQKDGETKTRPLKLSDKDTPEADQFKLPRGDVLYIMRRAGAPEKLAEILPATATVISPPPPEKLFPRPSFWARARFNFKERWVKIAAVSLNHFRGAFHPGAAWKTQNDFPPPPLSSLLPQKNTAFLCEMISSRDGKPPGLILDGQKLSAFAKKRELLSIDKDGKLTLEKSLEAESAPLYALQPASKLSEKNCSGFLMDIMDDNMLIIVMFTDLEKKMVEELKGLFGMKTALYFKHSNPECRMISGKGLPSDQIFLASPPTAGPTLILVPDPE